MIIGDYATNREAVLISGADMYCMIEDLKDNTAIYDFIWMNFGGYTSFTIVRL